MRRTIRRTPLVVAVLLLALLASVAVVAATARSSGAVRLSAASPGQRALVMVPREPTGRLVLYVHAAGQDERSITADPQTRRLTEALLRNGYAVAATRAEGRNWGNAASLRDYRDLYASASKRLPVRAVYLLAESMGGIGAALLLAHRAIPDVRAWAGIYPATNLGAIYRAGRYAGQIERAYGFAGRAGYAAATAGHDPARVALPPLHGLPVLIWASPGDTHVAKAANADTFAAAARRAGARVTVVTTEGEHGDPSNFDPARLVAFFDAAPVRL